MSSEGPYLIFLLKKYCFSNELKLKILVTFDLLCFHFFKFKLINVLLFLLRVKLIKFQIFKNLNILNIIFEIFYNQQYINKKQLDEKVYLFSIFLYK